MPEYVSRTMQEVDATVRQMKETPVDVGQALEMLVFLLELYRKEVRLLEQRVAELEGRP